MITIEIDARDALRQLNDIEKRHVPFALAVSLTRTAKDIEAATYNEFRKVFDRPTPFTLKSLRTKPATKRDLSAEVFMKDRALGKNPLSASETLGHQFTGGARVFKQIEVVLARNNFITRGEYVVPGAAARLDRYGNMSRGQIVQILSQIGVKNSGSDSSPTGSKRSRKNVAKAGVIFWSRGANGRRMPVTDKATGITYGFTGGNASTLAKGAWIRDGRNVHPILLVVKRVSYKRRVYFEAIGRSVALNNINKHFSTALEHALATAR